MNLFEFASYDALLAAAAFLIVLCLLLGVKAFVARQLRRLAQTERLGFLAYAEQMLDATRLPFMLGVALLTAVSQFELSPRHEKWLQYAWVIVLILQIALWANRMISLAVERAFLRHRASDPAGATHLMLAGLVARIALWSIALLVTLDNLGFNITTLMASLGVGGVAVALAVQNILGDIFSSISIAVDKPFVIGDFIIVDDYLGTVEHVGLKTTRLRSLGGEQIIFSNTELLKQRIRNYKRMQERRVLFEFGVSYDTALEEVERIPRMVQEIIEAQCIDGASTRFDRAHFKAYGESALQFEVVYHVTSPDYNKYMDIQQAINLALLRGFRERGIAFAHPVRMLHMPPARGKEGGEAGSLAHPAAVRSA